MMGNNENQIQVAQIKSVHSEVRYPIGLIDLEYGLLQDSGGQTGEIVSVRLILTAEQAEAVGTQILKISTEMKKLDGKGQ